MDLKKVKLGVELTIPSAGILYVAITPFDWGCGFWRVRREFVSLALGPIRLDDVERWWW